MVLTQKLASLLTTLRSIMLSLVFLILIVWNFGAINTSAKEVLGMVSHVQQFEANGIKVVLRDDARLKASLAIVADHLTETQKRDTIEAVQKLTGVEAERLFTIEKDQSSCDYTSPTPRMRLFVYIDAALADLGLLEISDNPEAFEQETLRITREGSDIGKPRSCYSMRLTPRGYDAKSALVSIIRQQLG